MKQVPLWKCRLVTMATACSSAAMMALAVQRGWHENAALDAALAVLLYMAPLIVDKANNARRATDDVASSCVAFKVLGKHDGVPCASCETQALARREGQK